MTTTARRRGVSVSSARHTVARAIKLASWSLSTLAELADFPVVASSNGRLPPLVAADVDEHTDEPGFLARQSEWNRRRGAGGLEECLLHEVQRVHRRLEQGAVRGGTAARDARRTERTAGRLGCLPRRLG